MRNLLVIILLMLVPTDIICQSQMINIGIFYHNKPIQSFVFTPTVGKYAVYTDTGKIIELYPNDMIYVSLTTNGILVQNLDTKIGLYNRVNIIGVNQENSFKIKCEQPNYKIRFYDDNLIIKKDNKRLVLINNIDLDNYVAGVVEAEVGINPPEEYFKLQAIMCRTYALKSYNRHEKEGFNLCDRVHCQAYHGRPKNEKIRMAAYETSGIVIVDSDINLITAVFHSNCGGQTANSEDVWSKKIYYLSSVKDTFCISENNACWRKEIPKSKWLNYLHHKLNLDLSDSLSLHKVQHIEQNNREKQLVIDSNHVLDFITIREDFKLKSAFFYVKQNGDTIVFEGRGFGHGVGLCQEGAMKMAKMGYSYPEILHYYFRGVHMVHISTLSFFKEE